jgi:hypothetical protein
MPAVLGCALFYKGFSVVFVQMGYTGVRSMILIVAIVSSIVVMLVTVAVCVRQLGS